MPLRRCLFLAACLALTIPSATNAAVRVDTAQTRASLAVAEQFYGQRPACGTPAVYVAEQHELPFDDAAEGAAPGGCEILIRRSTYQGSSYATRINVCGLIAHGYGHSLGIDRHTFGTVMGEFWTGLPWAVYGCYRRFLPRGKAWEFRGRYGKPRWLARP